MAENNTKSLNTWDKKILRRIPEPVIQRGMWGIKTNQELQEMYTDMDIVIKIKRQERLFTYNATVW
jgi:hypothetical protein